MDPIRFSIENPVKVAVALLLTILFGLIALNAIPIQLTPNVDQPIITVDTNWTGRSPEEVEREIVEEQEDKLKGLKNLRKMTSTANQGSAEIELEFYVGTDIDRARNEVSDKLREVPEYPDDVDEPVVTAADSASSNAMAWLILHSDDPEFDIQGFFDTADRRIKPILERVSGIGRINIYGGREREVHVRIDPVRMAQRGVTMASLVSALRGENLNVSAGTIPEGRLDVSIRAVGQYDNLDAILQTIVAYNEGGPVRVGDIGDAVLTLEKRRGFVRSKGEYGLAFQVIRETGSNVMSTMAELRERINYVNRNVLPELGPGLSLRQVYDETLYIDDAISLVKNNLFIGGSLAVLCLLMFLRTVRPTVIVALSIPVSVIGTFVVMTAAGRNINVISLAGLAFAVGMVVDAAIVVLENIDRHLLMGKAPRTAAYDGAKEVWGAILASVLTTVAVFVPVIFMQEEAGQLFRDIAIAICASVLLSLVVSISVIPSASARFLRRRKPLDQLPHLKREFKTLFGLTGLLGLVSDGYSNLMYRMTAPGGVSIMVRLGIVAVMTVLSLVGAWLLAPPSSYLPTGNRNLVFGIMFTPPGYNIEQAESIGHRVEARIRPYWEADDYDDLEGQPPVFMAFPPFAEVPHVPPIENYFFVRWGSNIFMGAMSTDEQNVAPLGHLLSGAMNSVPGSFGFASQASLFGRGLSGTNAVEVEVTASDLDRLREVAQQLNGMLVARYGPQNVQPSPLNYDLPGPELQVTIDRVRAADLGIDMSLIGLGMQALIDGATIGDYRAGDQNIDLVLTRYPSTAITPENLGMVPLVAVSSREGETPGVVPLSQIANFTRTDAPQQIHRIEQRRAVIFSVTAPPGTPLESTMQEIEQLRNQVLAQYGGDVEVQLAGSADKLTEVRRSLLGQWTGGFWEAAMNLLQSRMFLALLVVFLLMAALFESFLYPAVIMFTVPLATIGGFLGLRIVHYFDESQQLDVLAMLGFVILIGIVVNNAILIVHQALNFMRGVGETGSDQTGRLGPREAIRESVRTRIRPIFMTTATSVFGMLPLVLMPGSGSELYRGLGSVVVGGLVLSTMFTLLVVPLLFSVVLEARSALMRMTVGQESAEPDAATPVA